MIDRKKYQNKHVTIKADETGKEEMSYYELARWMCLVEAIDFIDGKAKQLKLAADDKSWVKPLAIQKYIDERTDGMIFELTNQGKV
jgi:hypothetical protein